MAIKEDARVPIGDEFRWGMLMTAQFLMAMHSDSGRVISKGTRQRRAIAQLRSAVKVGCIHIAAVLLATARPSALGQSPSADVSDLPEPRLVLNTTRSQGGWAGSAYIASDGKQLFALSGTSVTQILAQGEEPVRRVVSTGVSACKECIYTVVGRSMFRLNTKTNRLLRLGAMPTRFSDESNGLQDCFAFNDHRMLCIVVERRFNGGWTESVLYGDASTKLSWHKAAGEFLGTITVAARHDSGDFAVLDSKSVLRLFRANDQGICELREEFEPSIDCFGVAMAKEGSGLLLIADEELASVDSKGLTRWIWRPTDHWGLVRNQAALLSPEGTTAAVLVISLQGEADRLVFLDFDLGEPVISRIVRIPSSAGCSFEYSPDGKRLAIRCIEPRGTAFYLIEARD